MQGAKTWPAYPALSAPLTIMGVERRWFLLRAMLGLAMWNAINSLVTGGVIFVVLYGAGWFVWRDYRPPFWTGDLPNKWTQF